MPQTFPSASTDRVEDRINKTNRLRIPSLDGMRAIAILLVVLGHAFGGREMPANLRAVLAFLFNGPLGVQVFFALSGFLITHLLLNEQDKTSRIDLRAFYRRRFFRIIPASYLYLVSISVLSLVGIISVSTNFLAASFGYVLNYQTLWKPQGHGYWFVGHFWTLCLEQQFYLCWPALLGAMPRTKAAFLAGGLVVILPGIRVLQYVFFPSTRGQLGMMFHTGSDALFLGALAALILRLYPTLKLRIRSLHWGIPFGLGVWLFFLAPLIFAAIDGKWRSTVGQPFSALAATVLLLWCVENPASRFGQFLNSKPLVYMGTISYGLYLWQQVFLWEAGQRSLVLVLVGIAAAFLVAMLSFHFFETPLLRFGKASARPNVNSASDA